MIKYGRFDMNFVINSLHNKIIAIIKQCNMGASTNYVDKQARERGLYSNFCDTIFISLCGKLVNEEWRVV